MLNFNQQDQGLFPFIKELGQVHPLVPYALAGMGSVGGYAWGVNQERLPVVLCMALGLVGGLLLVGILVHLAEFVLASMIVIGIAAGTYFLLHNDTALKAHGTALTDKPSAPARPGWLQSLKEVMP